MLQLVTEDAVFTPAECEALITLCAPQTLAAGGIALRQGASGSGAEIPVDFAPLFGQVTRTLLDRLGLPGAPVTTLRLRDCAVGQGHPPHLDDYAMSGRWLAATAVLYLDACEGGRTRFPVAGRVIEPQPGRIACWLNLDAQGQPEASSLHDMEPVTAGRRRALFLFAYATAGELAAARPDSLAAHLGDVDPATWPVPRTLHLVTTPSVPEETVNLLQQAARQRRVAVELHDPAHPGDALPLPDGDLLFCPAVAPAAGALERRLWQPGVTSFHTQPRGPYAEIVDPTGLYSALGLPVPRSERLRQITADSVAAAVERLGGLPVVAKLDGGEGGTGVMRLESLTSLQSVLEAFAMRGEWPLLQAHVAEAMHWRLVVVGERVVAAYRNPLGADGFRSGVSDDLADYTATPPDGAADLAVAAARALQVAFAGVDVLAHPSGRLYLIEANFPCYFPMAQRIAGIDIAGAMLDELLARADRAEPHLAAAALAARR